MRAGGGFLVASVFAPLDLGKWWVVLTSRRDAAWRADSERVLDLRRDGAGRAGRALPVDWQWERDRRAGRVKVRAMMMAGCAGWTTRVRQVL